MTSFCQQWIKYCVSKYPVSGPVLEVGSFDVNGSPRQHFTNLNRFPSYLGIDMRPGPGVDRVMNSQALGLADKSFGVVVDAERMEHDNRFWLTAKELFRVCQNGGHVIITTRSWAGFPPHDYPNDYWRFMLDGLKDLMDYAGFECLDSTYGENNQAVYAIGRKP